MNINDGSITRVGEVDGWRQALRLCWLLLTFGNEKKNTVTSSLQSRLVLVPVISIPGAPGATGEPGEGAPHICIRLQCNIHGSFLLFIGGEEGLRAASAEDVDKSLYRGRGIVTTPDLEPPPTSILLHSNGFRRHQPV